MFAVRYFGSVTDLFGGDGQTTALLRGNLLQFFIILVAGLARKWKSIVRIQRLYSQDTEIAYAK